MFVSTKATIIAKDHKKCCFICYKTASSLVTLIFFFTCFRFILIKHEHENDIYEV